MTDGQDRTDDATADAHRANATVPTGRLRGLSITLPGPPSRLVVDGFATVHRDGRIEYADGYGPNEASRAFWDAVGWRARETAASSSERPGCASPIREAGEVTTEVRLLALPVEPSVGSEVEVRIPPRPWTDHNGIERVDGGVCQRYVSVDDPRSEAVARRVRRWAKAETPEARALDRVSWRFLCSSALSWHDDGVVVLTREGPAPTTEGNA